MQTRCSFKSAIEKSTKTMTEAQEKNHTDPIDLSSRMQLGQLMRRAVTYTRQAGADGTNVPLPSRKKILVIFGPPTYCSCTKHCWHGQFYTTFFFSPPSWILCVSIANEQSLSTVFVQQTTFLICTFHLISMSQHMQGCLSHILVPVVWQANTGLFYAQEHNQRYCLYNGKWYGLYQWGYHVQITTTDLRILRNVYILNSLSNNAAPYNTLRTLPFKFPTTHYSCQSFHFIPDYVSSGVGIPSLPRWTKFKWSQMHMDWSWKDP